MAPIRGTTGVLARRNNAENQPIAAKKRVVSGASKAAASMKRPLGLSNKENVLSSIKEKGQAAPLVVKKPRVTRAKSTTKRDVPRTKGLSIQNTSKSSASSQSDVSSQTSSQSSSSSQLSIHSQEKSAGFLVAASPEPEVSSTPDRQRRRPPPAKPVGVVNFDEKPDFFGSSALVRDIFDYFRERELQFVCSDYLAEKIGSASVMKPNMRAILVDWMVEYQEEFELTHETLYLGVKLVDRFLSRESVQTQELQLVGAVCMYLAAKYEEKVVSLPYLDQVQVICQSIYTQDQIKKMERRVFRGIGFDLGMPTSYTFLRRYARTLVSPNHELTLARYILETSLMDYDLSINCLESVKAGAALYLARKMMNVTEPVWNSTIEWHSGLSLEDIRPDVVRLHRLMKTPLKGDLQIIKNKYSHEVFSQVATVPVPDEVF